MAATVKKNIWWLSAPDGAPPEVLCNQKIAASQGILIPNAPLYLSQSGTWKVCDTSDASDAWHGLLVGLENADSTWPLTAELAGNTEIRVAIIDPADYYAVYVEAGGTDAAATQALIGNEYGLVVSTTAGQVGYVSLNTSNSNDTVVVKQVFGNVEPTKFDLTTAPGVAVVRFLNAVVEAEKA